MQVAASVPAGSFHPKDYRRGAIHRLHLAIPLTGGDTIDVPVLLARGASDGPCLVATASVHGDEYEGVRALLDLFDELDPQAMSGDLLAVPVMNPPAFRGVSRTSTLDGLNLARVFPGNPQGQPTEALAWHLDQSVIRHADLYIDLHSGGVRYEMPALVGYLASDARAKAAALAFGAEVLWAHPTIAPGRTISAAYDRGIPALYTEARGAGRIHPEDLSFLMRGLRNLLAYLGIVVTPVMADSKKPILVLTSDGNIDESILCDADGFLIPTVSILERVSIGQTLGRLVDTMGQTVRQYTAPRNGVVALVHACPVVQSGEPVFLVAPESGE